MEYQQVTENIRINPVVTIIFIEKMPLVMEQNFDLTVSLAKALVAKKKHRYFPPGDNMHPPNLGTARIVVRSLWYVVMLFSLGFDYLRSRGRYSFTARHNCHSK